jgi:putative flavoprotein involved in K+ transport
MSTPADNEHLDVAVVGAGQAGLAVGYHLAKRGVRFVILDAGSRVGDSWRHRWDSLLLFTPARIDGLPEMPFPSSARLLPTKDAMADYLEAYASRFKIPVRSGVVVDGLDRDDGHFLLKAGGLQIRADQVVVTTGANQVATVPPFANELDPGILQLSAAQYRNPSDLKDGDVLVVGAGNSGTEIAIEAAKNHRTLVVRKEHRAGFPSSLFTARLVAGHEPPDQEHADGPQAPLQCRGKRRSAAPHHAG